jgi:hypothetical protein
MAEGVQKPKPFREMGRVRPQPHDSCTCDRAYLGLDRPNSNSDKLEKNRRKIDRFTFFIQNLNFKLKIDQKPINKLKNLLDIQFIPPNLKIKFCTNNQSIFSVFSKTGEGRFSPPY